MLGLLQRVGRREMLSQKEAPERSSYSTPHTTLSGHGKFPPDDKEFLGELPTQTPHRHGDLQTLQRIHW
jgi:hypothetical protein